MKMRLPRVLTSVTAALFASVFAGPLLAQPTGGFIAVLDDDRNNGDSSNTVLYYDVDDMSTPMFAIFAGWKKSNTQIVLGTPSTTGTSRSLSSLTVNPNTGFTYVLGIDRDGPIGSAQVPGPNDSLFGVPNNTEGDYNLLTFDFVTAYNDWVTNQGGAYVTYVSQGTLADPLAPAPAPGEHDLRVDNIQSYTDGPPNLNEVFLSGLVQKVGEVARPEFNDFTASGHSYIDTYLDYIDDNTLVLLDRPNAPLSDATLVAAMTQADDSTVRILNRSSLTPGGSAPYVPGSTEGGFDAGTTETWESTIIGQPLSDSTSPGEYVDVALVNNRDGVTGLWIVENDQPAGTGDEVSFFEITNLTGPAGNGLREFNVGGGPNFPTNFILDDNPVIDPSTNDGDVNGVHLNRNTGDLFVIESGFFDTPQDEPSVIIRNVIGYDNTSGQIEFGAWKYLQLDLTALPDDDTFVTEGRRSVYDDVNNVMYFYDFDNDGVGGGGSFVFDWYALDLNTGAVTVALLDVDESTRGFGTEDRYEFFCLGASCDTFVDPFPVIDGDLNEDGFVGIADLNIVLSFWNQNVSVGNRLKGDPSGDGFVGIVDLNVVLGNWNAGTPPADGSVVPEPASLALFTMAGLAALGRRRTRA
jgi:PEP-CTERM motif